MLENSLEQKSVDPKTERPQVGQSPRKMVLGANLLSHFNVRCPACDKLFRVDSREIKSSSPYFDCTACKSRFSFDYPPANVNKIETFVVSQKETFQLTDSVDRSVPRELKKCPKCSSLNPQLSKECLKCGVFFERVESLGTDGSLGAIPSLVKTWQELMSDYDNIKKHMVFVNRCEDLQALPFALKKYQTLKDAQPQDSTAQDMLHQVLLKNIKTQAQKFSGYQQIHDSVGNTLSKVNWPRVRKVAPLAISLSMVLMGLFVGGYRNLVGIGAAMAFLTLGLTIFIKGRISWQDFW
ncbi:MAG: hypothetical protein COT73_06145 [Bdellovibrio sp. CG10_big_fil_rev_8_21_14_0_10_47_8]|nr:MAG: hypothetical protein COT73_06145 [Bdellovibrio sp. CG10_big_fil_rev_8_21_14_0_10_47_8]